MIIKKLSWNRLFSTLDVRLEFKWIENGVMGVTGQTTHHVIKRITQVMHLVFTVPR